MNTLKKLPNVHPTWFGGWWMISHMVGVKGCQDYLKRHVTPSTYFTHGTWRNVVTHIHTFEAHWHKKKNNLFWGWCWVGRMAAGPTICHPNCFQCSNSNAILTLSQNLWKINHQKKPWFGNCTKVLLRREKTKKENLKRTSSQHKVK